MNRTLSEKKALKQLGIPDFRHMTKDKIIQFSSMLHKMDPEVAKAALEQFPEFTNSAKEIVNCLATSIDNLTEANKANTQSCFDICNGIVDSLKEQLKDENLTFEQKMQIEDKMIVVAQMVHEKDSENKKFSIWMTAAFGLIGTAILGGIASAIGINSSTDGDSSDDEDIIDI